MCRKLFVIAAILVALPLVAHSGSRTYKSRKVDSSKYNSVLLYNQPGKDTYSYSALVPKCGKGRCLLERSGGQMGKSLYAKFKLQGCKYSKMTVDTSQYKSVPLYKELGKDSYSYTALVPKAGKGPILLQRSGGVLFQNLYSKFGF